MTKSIQLSILILFACMYTLIAQETISGKETSTITVDISCVGSDEGHLHVGLYSDKTNWLQDAPYGSKTKIINGNASVVFEDIPIGEYAISIFHDENDNGELDANFLGIPNEPFACSNGAQGRFGPPKWTDAVFKVEGIHVKQHIKF